MNYVSAWDEDGDGLMESPTENGTRGIATYHEGGGSRAWTGGDLVAVPTNEIAVYQSEARETRIENHSGSALARRAVFAGEHVSLLVDRQPVEARTRVSESGTRESSTELGVGPGEAPVVRVPKPGEE